MGQDYVAAIEDTGGDADGFLGIAIVHGFAPDFEDRLGRELDALTA